MPLCQVFRWYLPLVCLLSLACSPADAEPSDIEDSDQSIIGGIADPNWALNWALDAVVMITMKLPDGIYSACSGVLVDKAHVLTAAHCIVTLNDDDTLSNHSDFNVFVGGHLEEIAEAVLTDSVTGGHTTNRMAYPEGESNLGMLRLKKPIPNVKPFEVNLAPLKLGTIGVVVGYGDSTKTDDITFGLRKAAKLQVAAQKGMSEEKALFPNFAAYVLAVRRALGRQITASERKQLETNWEDVNPYEADFMAKSLEGNPCHGDSGAPLLVWNGSKFQVRGIYEAFLIAIPGEEDDKWCATLRGHIFNGLSNADATAFIQREL